MDGRADARSGGQTGGVEHTLHETFELTGRFWFPEDPETRIGGILRYSSGRITLELLGAFGSLGRDEVREAETIVGLTNEGPCTLRKCARTDATWSLFVGEGETHRSSWRALHLFVGAEFPTAEDALFRSVRFRFDQLEHWLATAAFTQQQVDDDDTRRIVTTYEFPQEERVELPGLEGALTLGTILSRSGEIFSTMTLSRKAHIEIEPTAPQSFDWFMDRLFELDSLVGLLVGDAVAPTEIFGVTPGDDAKSVSILFRVQGEPRDRALLPPDMILPHTEMGSRFPEIVERWFTRIDDLRTVIALLFGTLVTELPTEFRFLALTQALETLHRHTHDGLYLSEEGYEPIRKALVDAIPNGTPADLRQSLKSRIGYGNELAQRRRLKELLASLGDEVAPVASSGPGWIDRIVDMRNHLTHYPAGQNPPIGPTDLFYETFRLRAFVTLLLLAEVGIQGAEAAEGVRRTRWYRGYVGA